MADSYGFDEDRAVKFIRETLPADVNRRYTDDDILYVIDIMYDWYEKNGYLDLSSEVTDEEIDHLPELVAYVKKELANDKEMTMDPDHIELIVKGELQYEESLEDTL